METETFQHYQVLRREDGSLWELGRGAMGVTYKAFDVNLRCAVALKVVNQQHLESEVARQRFVREARAAAALRHRHIASVYHLGNDAESFFYSMEFVDGETVEHLINRVGPLLPTDALLIAAQVARALGAAAKQGLVHRDIKPANIMVVQEDDEDPFIVKVIDFGLARPTASSEASAHITQAGFVGTPQYASPEQIEEQNLDSRSDIYSLGITLWYMLKGQPPFTGSIFRISSQHLTKEPPWEQLAHLPQPVLALLGRMLQKDPANRPQNPLKLRLEIEAVWRQLPPPSAPSPLDTRALDSPLDESESSTLDSDAPAPLAIRQPLGAGGSTDSASLQALATDLQGPPPAVGAILAERYVLMAGAGEGSLGRVFRATDSRRDSRPVAIKIFHPELGLSPQEFYQLQGDLGRLRAAPHPRLIEPIALEQSRGYRYLAEEWISGFTLVDLLRRRGCLPLPEALHLLDQAAGVAAHCTSQGLHRLEMAAHQVLVHFPGEFSADRQSEVRALVDAPMVRWPEFGLKFDAMAPTRESIGAPTWGGAMTVAPQAPRLPTRDTQSSIRGLLDNDYFYGLGALLFEMLSGAPPPPDNHHGRDLPPLPALNEAGNQVLRRALSARPDFGSEQEFFEALLAASHLARADLRLTGRPAPSIEVPGEAALTTERPAGLPLAVVPVALRPPAPVNARAATIIPEDQAPLRVDEGRPIQHAAESETPALIIETKAPACDLVDAPLPPEIATRHSAVSPALPEAKAASQDRPEAAAPVAVREENESKSAAVQPPPEPVTPAAAKQSSKQATGVAAVEPLAPLRSAPNRTRSISATSTNREPRRRNSIVIGTGAFVVFVAIGAAGLLLTHGGKPVRGASQAKPPLALPVSAISPSVATPVAAHANPRESAAVKVEPREVVAPALPPTPGPLASIAVSSTNASALASMSHDVGVSSGGGSPTPAAPRMDGMQAPAAPKDEPTAAAESATPAAPMPTSVASPPASPAPSDAPAAPASPSPIEPAHRSSREAASAAKDAAKDKEARARTNAPSTKDHAESKIPPSPVKAHPTGAPKPPAPHSDDDAPGFMR